MTHCNGPRHITIPVRGVISATFIQSEITPRRRTRARRGRDTRLGQQPASGRGTRQRGNRRCRPRLRRGVSGDEQCEHDETAREGRGHRPDGGRRPRNAATGRGSISTPTASHATGHYSTPPTSSSKHESPHSSSTGLSSGAVSPSGSWPPASRRAPATPSGSHPSCRGSRSPTLACWSCRWPSSRRRTAHSPRGCGAGPSASGSRTSVWSTPTGSGRGSRPRSPGRSSGGSIPPGRVCPRWHQDIQGPLQPRGRCGPASRRVYG